MRRTIRGAASLLCNLLTLMCAPLRRASVSSRICCERSARELKYATDLDRCVHAHAQRMHDDRVHGWNGRGFIRMHKNGVFSRHRGRPRLRSSRSRADLRAGGTHEHALCGELQDHPLPAARRHRGRAALTARLHQRLDAGTLRCASTKRATAARSCLRCTRTADGG